MTFFRSHRVLLIASFTSVYFVWGSTYLAIKYAIETIPPWGMAASRFIVAGSVMLVLAMFAKEPALNSREKKYSILTGLLLMTANSVVCFVERWVPSGIAAVVVGAMPIWVLVIGRVFFKNPPAGFLKWLGAGVGLCGIVVIASGQFDPKFVGAEKYAILILLSSSWLWACGTHFQRKIVKSVSPFRYTAWQMLAGAGFVTMISFAFHEPQQFHFADVTKQSFEAWLYLVVFGSIVAFTAYSWLGRNVEPYVLSSYALVNPVIAVLLAWKLAGEKITFQFVEATLLVIVGLSLLLMSKKPRHHV